MKNQILIMSTCFFNPANESWKPYSRFSLNERINYRGTYPTQSIAGMYVKPDWTKQEKREDYEYRMCERGLRPFTYSDEQWQQHLSDMRDIEHEARCEAKNAWMYEF